LLLSCSDFKRLDVLIANINLRGFSSIPLGPLGHGSRLVNVSQGYSSEHVSQSCEIVQPSDTWACVRLTSGEAWVKLCLDAELLQGITTLGVLASEVKHDLRKLDPHHGVMNGLEWHVGRGSRLRDPPVGYAYVAGTPPDIISQVEQLSATVRRRQQDFLESCPAYKVALADLPGGYFTDGVVASEISSRGLGNAGHFDEDKFLSGTIAAADPDPHFGNVFRQVQLPTYFIFTNDLKAIPLVPGCCIIWDGSTTRHCSSVQGVSVINHYLSVTKKWANRFG
jgi:hypothetical protein